MDSGSQPLQDLWPGEGERLIKGEFQYNVVNSVVKCDKQRVAGA